MKAPSSEMSAPYSGGCEDWLEIDRQFANFMLRLAGGLPTAELGLAAALLSQARREGRAFLDLKSLAGQACPGQQGRCFPELDTWLKCLRESPVVALPESGERRPIVLDPVRGRLYLERYWRAQNELAAEIARRCASKAPQEADLSAFKLALNRLFPLKQAGEPGGFNWQKFAASVAVTKHFSVISGGPGTGKTTTVLKVLALLQESMPAKHLRIALTAPTGKAAMRLQEAIAHGMEDLDADPEIKDRLPREAMTIHRLLGAIPGSSNFRHNKKNQLALDVLVIDEASMVDTILMFRLLQAVPERAKVILLGDKDQLASVEAGSVLGEICATPSDPLLSQETARAYAEISGESVPQDFVSKKHSTEQRFQEHIVQLRQNYRFSEESGIYALSQAFAAGDAPSATALLKSKKYEDVTWNKACENSDLEEILKALVTEYFLPILKETDPLSALKRFQHFRILCALRSGPHGVTQINFIIERALWKFRQGAKFSANYHGRPIMITKNDYNLNLYNGDTGLILRNPMESSRELQAFFLDANGALRCFSPFRLPEHETAFAMTIHKSQGSEFERVFMLLPMEDSPLLTRELLYTGLTRARCHATVCLSETVLQNALKRSSHRGSGM